MGSFSTAGAAQCTCSAGYYSTTGYTSSGSCKRCASGKYSGAGATKCLTCTGSATNALQPNGISIQCGQYYVNGVITNRGRGSQGLLMNSRMIQGIFDTTVGIDNYVYPTSNIVNGVFYPAGQWNADRNTAEFVASMASWQANGKGINGFTVGLQGGQTYDNGGNGLPSDSFNPSAFNSDGSLRSNYLLRLKSVVDEAVRLNMVPMVSLFHRNQVINYFGGDSDGNAIDPTAATAVVRSAVTNFVNWVVANQYTNRIIVEIQNECDYASTSGFGLECSNLHTLLQIVRSAGILVGNSVANCDGTPVYPDRTLLDNSDVIFLHGNECADINAIQGMINAASVISLGYVQQPISFTEVWSNAESYVVPLATSQPRAGMGLLDAGCNDYNSGFQSPPVNWSTSSQQGNCWSNKDAFWAAVKSL